MSGFDRDYTPGFDVPDTQGAGTKAEREGPRKPSEPGGSVLLFRALAPIVGLFARRGSLEVVYSDLARARFGDGTGPHFRMRLHSLRPIRRVLASPELGCGESYMDGEWTLEQGDLAQLIGMFLRNLGDLNRTLVARTVSGVARSIMRSGVNDPHNSRRNAAHHYDIGNDLYRAFLDEGMNYSCAFFETPTQSLRDAQLNKLRTTMRRLEIGAGMNVLDIGCGWGELSRLIIRETQAGQVTGITLAENQLALARERADDLLRTRLDYELVDYREHARARAGTYHRVVSIGMFEHVGRQHFAEYFEAVRRLLRDDGRALIHSIMRPVRAETSSWILKYIFPGGYIPTLDDTVEAARQAGLKLVHEPFVHDSFHYAQTLRCWRRNFDAAWPKLDRGHYDERFRRMWHFYLCGSEASFDVGGLFVGQIVLARR